MCSFFLFLCQSLLQFNSQMQQKKAITNDAEENAKVLNMATDKIS